MKRIIFIGIFLIFYASSSFAKNYAFVDKTRVTLGDVINFTISLDDGGITPDISQLKKHFAIMEQGRASSVKIINGNYSKKIFFKYSLVPKATGVFIIPPININGQFTKEIKITVVKNSIKVIGDKKVFIDNLISNSSPFINEQIIYTFKIYHRVQVTNLNFSAPDFKGFMAKPIKPNKMYRENIEGLLFNVTEVSYILIPIKEGKIKIEGAELHFGIVLQNAQNSFFSDPFFGRMRVQRKVLNAKTLELNVKKLPPYKKNFSQIVGKIAIDVNIDKKKIKAGESVTLSIKIEGSGNLMDIEDVKVALPKSFKIYKDTPEENINLTEAGYSGTKIFRFAIVPLKSGSFTIKPIEVSFFDIVEKKYKLLKSDPITLFVKKADVKDVVINKKNGGVSKKEVEFLEKDILPLKTNFSSLKNNEALSINRFILLSVIPIVLFGLLKILLLFFNAKISDARFMLKKSDIAFKKAKKFDSDFLSNLTNALNYAILAIKGERGESLSYEEAKKIVTEKKGAILAETVVKFLEQIDSAKYSGFDKKKDYKPMFLEVKKILKKIT